MGYDKDNLIDCEPYYEIMHYNGKPTIDTIAECPDDHPIKNCSQTMDEVLGG